MALQNDKRVLRVFVGYPEYRRYPGKEAVAPTYTAL